MKQNSYDGKGTLYLIPTPIGNMDDITIRSLNMLKELDILLCEDTRETSKLLNHFNIKKKLVSCHEFNEDKMGSYVVEQLSNNVKIGLVTDQGSPIISDPGFLVSKAIIDAGYNVVALPGATAFTPALAMTGLVPYPFLFYGFLNAKSSKQKKELESLKNLKYTIIFYEAPHRIKETLINMLEVLGDRKIAIAREISKIHETVYRDKISNLIPLTEEMKGEIVIVVSGNEEVIDYSNMSIFEHVNYYILLDMPEKEAIKQVAKDRDVSKAIIYKEYHMKKGDNK